MLDIERRQRLVGLVERYNFMTVAELSKQLHVSSATIRRDLGVLSQRGMVERTHGGAARRMHTPSEMPEPPLQSRTSLQTDEKRRIGKAAAAHVKDRETVIISGGTTTVAMLPHLAGRQGLTIITNALNIALPLAWNPAITVVVIGGVLRHPELTLLGSLGEDAMKNLRADKLFMGSSAVHAEYGLTADDFAESRSDQTLISAAREVFVLADHTKIGRVAMVRVMPTQRITRMISGSELSHDQLALLNDRGVDIELV